MEEKNIQLFPHNEEAYELLCKSIENYPLAFIEHATGTGKSFILLKYLYTKMRRKRILFISMHDEMFCQLFDDQMPSLGISKDEFHTFDTLIYHNILKYDMKDIIRNYDCIVFDEAHHCGAEKWSVKIKELKELVLSTPGKVMIGATATGIRYLDDYTDVSEEYFDGKTVSRLPISKSILKNLLPAPLYINSLASCATTVDRVKKKLTKVLQTEETKSFTNRVDELEQKVSQESNIASVLQKYNVKPGEKYIVFCKNIDDLKQKRQEAEDWFKNIGPIRTFAAHSGQKKETNMSEISAFGEKRNEISLMFAVDIFNEGFHINGVDGVLMFRKTKSPIIYFQQLGRALSFSARKKQIKIFDFVDNISDNDVIYELYKEIIAEAKKLTQEHPENKELYEEILSRFQIIDEATLILDELKEIERIIDEKHIYKDLLNNAIIKLQEYRSFYPNSDFTQDYQNHLISYDYKRAYEYICKNMEHLKQEQIELLQSLNITICPFTSLPKKDREKILQGFETLAELNNETYKIFVKSYVEFYEKFNRRPSPNGDEYEYNLYKQHRYYLDELTPSKITKMIHNFPFKSTVEEIVLSGNYPDKEELEKYAVYISDKLLNNESLDSVEIKVSKKIKGTLSLKNLKLIQVLNTIDDIAYKIEESIEIIRRYKRFIDPNERFNNYIRLSYNKEVYKAISAIHKHAKKITTPQFKKLLELDIALPTIINKTLEDRLEELGEYNSVYEKEQHEGIVVLNDFIIFIVQNSRRPNPDIPEERKIALEYESHIRKSTVVKLREICNLLKSNRIELTFYEKVIIGDYIPQETIDKYIRDLEDKVISKGEITEEELKIIRAIDRHGYKVSINYLKDLIKMFVSLRDVTEDVDKLEKMAKNLRVPNRFGNLESRGTLLRRVSSNKKYLTKSLIERLLKIGVKISDDLITEVNSLEGYINVAYKEILTTDSLVEELFTYIKKHNKIPDIESNLYQRYRDYLAKLSNKNAITFIKQILETTKKIGIEECIILGEYSPYDPKVKEYILSKKTKEELDDLERKVLNILSQNYTLTKDDQVREVLSITRRKPKTHSPSLESEIVARMIESINVNPEREIDFSNTVHRLSSDSINKLKKHRKMILARRFLLDLEKRMRLERKPIRLLLTPKGLAEYEEYRKIEFITSEDKHLVVTMQNLNADLELQQEGIERKRFLVKYIEFIKSHNGNKPSIFSENDEERQLAEQYQSVKEKLSSSELKLVENTIIEVSKTTIEESFFDLFHSFIITYGRFPCGNSDNPDEVQLNNLYIALSETLTKEQQKIIRALRKKYTQATLAANLEFTRKAQEKAQGKK